MATADTPKVTQLGCRPINPSKGGAVCKSPAHSRQRPRSEPRSPPHTHQRLAAAGRLAAQRFKGNHTTLLVRSITRAVQSHAHSLLANSTLFAFIADSTKIGMSRTIERRKRWGK